MTVSVSKIACYAARVFPVDGSKQRPDKIQISVQFDYICTKCFGTAELRDVRAVWKTGMAVMIVSVRCRIRDLWIIDLQRVE